MKSWDNYTIDYDAEGNKVSRTMIYDDGREVLTSYVDDFMM
jgi:YD repeat-containing protein